MQWRFHSIELASLSPHGVICRVFYLVLLPCLSSPISSTTANGCPYLWMCLRLSIYQSVYATPLCLYISPPTLLTRSIWWWRFFVKNRNRPLFLPHQYICNDPPPLCPLGRLSVGRHSLRLKRHARRQSDGSISSSGIRLTDDATLRLSGRCTRLFLSA